ncbi:MAG: PulJ/GspJ family protein, partial [Planctomycetota bacterium]
MNLLPSHKPSGFTLIEVMLAVAVTGMAMVAISGAFISTLRAREEVQTLSESTEAGERILTLLERDLNGLWH